MLGFKILVVHHVLRDGYSCITISRFRASDFTNRLQTSCLTTSSHILVTSFRSVTLRPLRLVFTLQVVFFQQIGYLLFLLKFEAKKPCCERRSFGMFDPLKLNSLLGVEAWMTGALKSVAFIVWLHLEAKHFLMFKKIFFQTHSINLMNSRDSVNGKWASVVTITNQMLR